MPIFYNEDTICGVGNETTAGTEVVVTQKQPFISADFQRIYEQVPNDQLLGSTFRRDPRQGMAPITGSLVIEWTDDMQNMLLEHFFGTYTSETPPTHNHFDLDERIDGDTVTISFERKNAVWTYTGVTIGGCTISGTAGQPVTLNFTVFAMNELQDTATNTTAVLAALSNPGAVVMYHRAVNNLFIGDLVDDLAVADNVHCTTWTLALSRNMEQVFGQSQTPLEAQGGGFFSAMLDIDLAQGYDSDYWKDAHDAETPQQMQVTWATSGTTEKMIRCPRMLVTVPALTTTAPGLAPHQITMEAVSDFGDTNTSTGMDFSAPVRAYELA